MIHISWRTYPPNFIGRYSFGIGPAGNYWVGFWSCPLHGWHRWIRIPFTHKVW